MKKISTYISRKDAVKIKENYIQTFGADGWDKLQARAKFFDELYAGEDAMLQDALDNQLFA